MRRYRQWYFISECESRKHENFLTRTSSTIVDFLHAVYGQHWGECEIMNWNQVGLSILALKLLSELLLVAIINPEVPPLCSVPAIENAALPNLGRRGLHRPASRKSIANNYYPESQIILAMCFQNAQIFLTHFVFLSLWSVLKGPQSQKSLSVSKL